MAELLEGIAGSELCSPDPFAADAVVVGAGEGAEGAAPPLLPPTMLVGPAVVGAAPPCEEPVGEAGGGLEGWLAPVG